MCDYNKTVCVCVCVLSICFNRFDTNRIQVFFFISFFPDNFQFNAFQLLYPSSCVTGKGKEKSGTHISYKYDYVASHIDVMT